MLLLSLMLFQLEFVEHHLYPCKQCACLKVLMMPSGVKFFLTVGRAHKHTHICVRIIWNLLNIISIPVRMCETYNAPWWEIVSLDTHIHTCTRKQKTLWTLLSAFPSSPVTKLLLCACVVVQNSPVWGQNSSQEFSSAEIARTPPQNQDPRLHGRTSNLRGLSLSHMYRWVPLNPNKQYQVKFFQFQ